jgi:hypothetical protein
MTSKYTDKKLLLSTHIYICMGILIVYMYIYIYGSLLGYVWYKKLRPKTSRQSFHSTKSASHLFAAVVAAAVVAVAAFFFVHTYYQYLGTVQVAMEVEFESVSETQDNEAKLPHSWYV